MDAIKRLYNTVNLTFTKSGLGYVISRVPSMIIWAAFCTGALIGAQYLYFSVLPANYFFKYDSPAKVSNTTLGETPTLSYCRSSKGDYPVTVDAQLRKVEPPVYTQQYQVKTSLPQGSGCIVREVANKPNEVGDYRIYYTVRAELPFGVEKVSTFYTDSFTVGIPKNIYGDYTLTINELDEDKDGSAVYKPGQNLQYAFTANALVEYFGTTERHLICSGVDYFIDSYSGRSTAGLKDSVNSTINIPGGLKGSCHLELRITATVGNNSGTVTQTLTSNGFVVE